MDEGVTTAKIRVFLLDDHEIVRRGVRDLLEAEPDITVIGEAGTAASALARIPALKPDVAVLDIRLPDGDGVTVCRDLRSKMPQLACLMLTSFSDDEALFDAIMAGAAGYVLKQIRGTDLVGAIRTIASGQSLLDPEAAAASCAACATRPPPPTPSPASPTRNAASSPSSAKASPTARSATASSSPKKPSKTTSPPSSPNSACNAAPKPPPTPRGSSIGSIPAATPTGRRDR